MARVTVDLEARSPKAVALQGLSPDTEHEVRFDGVRIDVECRVRTLEPQPSAMTIAAVSCNKGRGEKTWKSLRDQFVLPGEIDLLFHLGDQVYADGVFEAAVDELRRKRYPESRIRKETLEKYRALYRANWGQDGARQVLAQTPSLMIWDDHEVVDDWGIDAEHRDPTSLEWKVGAWARQVFREYQRQLWDDPVSPIPVDQFEDHAHAWGGFGVLFVDQRTGRSFGYDAKRPYLGSQQWDRIRAALGPGGVLQGVKVLCVVTSVPLMYLGNAITNAGNELIDDLEDHWAFGPHRKEHIEMLRTLRRWKQAESGREVFILGGDVHIGCKTEICHKGEGIFQQLITSPVGRKSIPRVQYWPLRALLESEQDVGDRYSFEHRDYTRKRNYGIAVVRGIGSATPHVGLSLGHD